MLKILGQFVPQLTHDEKIELLKTLKVSIAEELLKSISTDIDSCTHSIRRSQH